MNKHELFSKLNIAARSDAKIIITNICVGKRHLKSLDKLKFKNFFLPKHRNIFYLASK